MKIGPCAQRALGVTFDVSLAVLSGSVASVRRREREIVHMKTGPCARCALSVTFDASWTGCALRQGCKCDSMVSLAPAPDSSLQLVSRAEALGHHVRCRR